MIVGKRSLKLVWHALRSIVKERLEKDPKDGCQPHADARDWFSKQLRAAPEGKASWKVDLPEDYHKALAEAMARIKTTQYAADMLGQGNDYQEDVERDWKAHLASREAKDAG